MRQGTLGWTCRAVLALAVPLLLGGCAAPPTNDGGDPAAAASASTRYGGPGAKHERKGQDVMFAMMVIPHNQQAIQLLQLRQERGASPGLNAVLGGAIAARQAHVPLLRTWVEAWGERVPDILDAHRAHLPGMAQKADLQALAALSGIAFDERWLRVMVAHDEGLVTICRTELDKGSFPGAHRLATDLISRMGEEIASLREHASP